MIDVLVSFIVLIGGFMALGAYFRESSHEVIEILLVSGTLIAALKISEFAFKRLTAVAKREFRKFSKNRIHDQLLKQKQLYEAGFISELEYVKTVTELQDKLP